MRPELKDLPQPNWFHHGEQILNLLEEHKPKVCVELGSNRGCSAIATARLIRRWGGILTCVDLWTNGPSEVTIDVFASNVLEAGVAPSIRMVYTKTVDAASCWVGGIDYLYVDADHTCEGCTLDLELWWPHLRVGGLITGDDYDDPDGNPELGVTKAWDEFEKRHQLKFERTETPECRSRLIWGIK